MEDKLGMEEKYGITDAHYFCDSAIFNTETNEILRLYQICDLLNYQDREIDRLTKMLYTTTKHADKLNEENKQLKQSQKQLAIEELEKLKVIDFKKIIFYSFTPANHIENLIDNKIKELRGEENENKETKM